MLGDVRRRQLANVSRSITQTGEVLTTEPCLGLYYIMEHVKRSVPVVVATKYRAANVRTIARALDQDVQLDREAVQQIASKRSVHALDTAINELMQAIDSTEKGAGPAVAMVSSTVPLQRKGAQ